jgi:hypothetical protein
VQLLLSYKTEFLNTKDGAFLLLLNLVSTNCHICGHKGRKSMHTGIKEKEIEIWSAADKNRFL